MPLSKEEVSTFLESLRTSRDLSIATLMLLCGLRSREVIELTLEDVCLSEGQIHVRGKGEKERFVPLPPQVTPLLGNYLAVERPKTRSQKLFVSLKGKKRGHAMTPAGLRSIFRYHRRCSGVGSANPHRWRHTFGSDMARAGISLAVLKKLMGHADIHTTMLYIEILPEDVREEFLRVLATIRDKRIPQKVDEVEEK
jgi:integrase